MLSLNIIDTSGNQSIIVQYPLKSTEWVEKLLSFNFKRCCFYLCPHSIEFSYLCKKGSALQDKFIILTVSTSSAKTSRLTKKYWIFSQ